jgi:transcriptional regulator with XRE-family HTH domain
MIKQQLGRAEKGGKMESITKCLATNIRNLRKEKNLTQTELAEKAGISLIFLQGIESERKWVSPATAKVLAKALEVNESKLFENCFEKKRASLSSHPRKSGNKPLEHLPEDIMQALMTTCRHPEWKWEAIRWIIQGYEREIRTSFS